MDLLNPREEAVNRYDIVYSLARIKRFTGHTTLSVAQHSIEVMMALYARPDFPGMLAETINGVLITQPAVTPRMALLYALLHDAHEAYTGDISRPMNNAIGEYAGLPESPVNPIKRDVQVVIHRFFGLPTLLPRRLRDAIAIADKKMLNIDRWLISTRAPMTEDEAQDGFLHTLNMLLRPGGAAFVGQFDEWPVNEIETPEVGANA